MRVLIDECCDAAVVRALRLQGHDVVAISEIAPRCSDSDIIALALSDERIIVTEDKDFGQLVYASARTTCGVVLVRFPAALQQEMIEAVVRVIQEKAWVLRGAFVVIKPGQVRIRKA